MTADTADTADTAALARVTEAIEAGEPVAWAELPPARGYEYVLPDSWFALDPSPKRSQREIQRVLDARIRRFPELDPHRKTLARLLRAQVNEAVKQDVRRIAMLSEPVDGRLVSASLLVQYAKGIPTQEDGVYDNDVESLAAFFAVNIPPDQDAGAPRDVGIVALPQQDVLRVQATTIAVDDRTGAEARGIGVQYFAPAPGADDVLILTFNTPNVDMSEPLVLLFDMIAQTFHWTWD
ncbi:MAG: hypothetical protein ACJ73S_32940 [Mycobacteriales bacterium]